MLKQHMQTKIMSDKTYFGPQSIPQIWNISNYYASIVHNMLQSPRMSHNMKNITRKGKIFNNVHINQCRPPICIKHDLEEFTRNVNCITPNQTTQITKIITNSPSELSNNIKIDYQHKRFICGHPNHEPIELRIHINIQNTSHISTTKYIAILKQFSTQARI